jgi:hypothetical protein
MESTGDKPSVGKFSLKDIVVSFALGGIYLLFAVRYFPGRPLDTLITTLEHLLVSLSFSFGCTLLIISIVAKATGSRPSGFFIVRLFLTIGIIVEFFFGLYHYLSGTGTL